MRIPKQALREMRSPHCHPLLAGVVDFMLYCLLSYGITTGSCAVSNMLHPHDTTTPDYASLALQVAALGALTGVIGFIAGTRAYENSMQRSLARSILGTALVITLTTGLYWALVTIFTDVTVSALDLVQMSGVISLVLAPIGYRFIGAIEDPNVVTVTLNGSKPDIALGPDGTMFEYKPDNGR